MERTKPNCFYGVKKIQHTELSVLIIYISCNSKLVFNFNDVDGFEIKIQLAL